MSELIAVSEIKQSPATQPRMKMDMGVIEDYSEGMKNGSKFPALQVFRVDGEYILVDGYHRLWAAQGAKVKKILCDVRDGTMRDAILFASGVNATHGLRRTNEDKRRAVERLLVDSEWSQWSDNKIAETCCVSHTFVNKLRGVTCNVASEESKEPPKTRLCATKHGTVTHMKTGNIGKTAQPPPVTAKDTARKERYGGKDGTEHQLADASKVIPPVTDSPTVREHLIVPPPCQSKQPCPGGESHVFHGAELGDKCEISGAFIRDAKYCPVLEQERRKAAGVKGEQFHPASMEMARTDPASRPIQHESANPSSQGIPHVKTTNAQTLTLTFSDKQWAVLKQIQREGLADGFEDAVLWLVDEKAAELESGN